MSNTASKLSIVALTHRAGPILLGSDALLVFASAFLLFSVQSLLSRLVLPWLEDKAGNTGNFNELLRAPSPFRFPETVR